MNFKIKFRLKKPYPKDISEIPESERSKYMFIGRSIRKVELKNYSNHF
jgi:FPC/CPF motif-containing protein YcgG